MARRRFSWGFMAPRGWMEPHRTRHWASVQRGWRVRSSGPDEAGSGYRGLNHSDPFGLSADTTGAATLWQASDSTWSDACAAYSQKYSLPTRAICTTVHGPKSGPENTCTANCLSDTWNQMFDGREEVPWSEQGPYWNSGHGVCYQACGYRVLPDLSGSPNFMTDLLLMRGLVGRADAARLYRTAMCIQTGSGCVAR